MLDLVLIVYLVALLMLVKVLGTFIIEWEKGAEICKTLLAMKESAQMYAEKLAELASALGFDGWLVSLR